MDRRSSPWSSKEENTVRIIRKGFINPFVYITILCSCLLILSACDRNTRYNVLTFFFTGVPPLDGEVDEAEEKGLSQEELLKKRLDELKVTTSLHGPYAAQQCYQCHSTGKTASFRESAKENVQSRAIKSLQDIAGRLVLPIKELCIDCHTEKSVESAFFKGYWIHGPVSDGICTVCHNPHASPYPFMLVKGDSKTMCSNCHASGLIMQTEEHKKDEDCINCHNPHIGKDRFLLKKDFDESSIK